MSPSRISEVLYDSETVLRLVDSELDELREEEPEAAMTAAAGSDNIALLLAVTQKANAEIASVIELLSKSRVALRDVPLQEISDSTAKLQEVSCATEVAAGRIMDGLERAHSLVDRLDRIDSGATTGDPHADRKLLRGKLRDELFAIMGSLQFQDITSQQLGHIAQMLRDVDRRLHAASSLLNGGCTEASVIAGEAAPTFAESASTRNAFERQATADAVFWAGTPPKRSAH